MSSLHKVIGCCLLASALMPCQAEKLVILHTNDTHSQIDPLADSGLGGVARRKVVIDSVRNAEPNTLLIDAGDIVQGSLFFNLYKGEVEEKIMNALGYDLRIMGNHEFDNDMQPLADNYAKSNATLICSNYDTRNTPLKDTFKTWAWEDIGGKRIAFMPINLQPKGMISSRNTVGLEYRDAIETANNMAWYLKNVENVDYVVAVTHIGYEVDTALVKSSRDIDALIGGHSHTLIDPANAKSPKHILKNADGKDVLVAQTGYGGQYVGEIVIDTDRLDDVPKYRLIRVDERLDDRLDPAIEEIIHPYRATVDSLNVHYVAESKVQLPRNGNAIANFIADFVYYRGKQIAPDVDMAILNKGSIRNTLPKGKISEGQVIATMPFFNRVQVIEISGDSLAANFDIMASQGGQGVSDNVNAVFDPDTKKCTEILISGKPIEPDKMYKIATLEYLAQGGDYMHPLVDHKLIGESPNYLFEDIVKYFTVGDGKGKRLNPSDKPRMKAIVK